LATAASESQPHRRTSGTIVGVTDESPQRRHRRRRRAVWRPGEGIPGNAEPQSPAVSEDVRQPKPTAPAPQPGGDAKPQPPKRRRGDPSERGLRELVGAGPSQVGPVRAMRARDANRPSDEDLARAEEEVVIVRRNWKPPKG
jgi:hypothetical protein